jgi:hypothetical protein
MADLTLPDTAHIGDPDHDVDHNLIVQAITDLNAEVAAGTGDSVNAVVAARMFG